MTLQQLHYIIAISETGSMNRAAEQLFISQPSLTSAVKELEKELGITIFLRSGRGVTLTNDGAEFLHYARQVYQQYELLMEKYQDPTKIRKKFAISSQHYSFAVKAFVNTVQRYDTLKYDLAFRETSTYDVILDVGSLRSEIGILYLSDFNRKVLTKLFRENNIEFHELIVCRAYVYISRNHPLAGEKSISLSMLNDYPCVSFEQKNGSMFLAEEILSDREYPRTIRTCDRATNLNLMVGLNAYTLCSGIICEELNGDDFVAVPFRYEDDLTENQMTIGYITRRNTILSDIGTQYVSELKKYLAGQPSLKEPDYYI